MSGTPRISAARTALRWIGTSGALRRMRIYGALLGLLSVALVTPMHAATWFGLVDTGELFASSDQGMNWEIHSTLPVRDAIGLAAGSSPSQLYLASRTGIAYRSTNGGVDWDAVGSIDASDVVDLLMRADLSLLVLTETGGVYRSTDSGTSFSAIASITAQNFVSLTRVTPVGAHYALTATGDVYESADGGVTWVPKGTFAAPNAVKLRAASSNLVAITAAGDTYRSTDAGTTWLAIGTLSHVGTSALAVDGTTLLAALETGEVATSTTGATWIWQGAMNQLRVSALATDTLANTGVDIAFPRSLLLGKPWPNPGKPGIPISFGIALTRADRVAVELIDVTGRRVAARTEESLTAGQTILSWNPGSIASNVYGIRVTTESGLSATSKWTLLR